MWSSLKKYTIHIINIRSSNVHINESSKEVREIKRESEERKKKRSEELPPKYIYIYKLKCLSGEQQYAPLAPTSSLYVLCTKNIQIADVRKELEGVQKYTIDICVYVRARACMHVWYSRKR